MNPKQLVLGLARRLGANAALASSGWRQNRLLILCYHGVSLGDEHLADPSLYVTPLFFRRRLERLRQGRYRVLRLGDALTMLDNGTLPPRAVVITFDDGTRDFAEIVTPLLQEFEMPATVYLTTYYCEHALPVFDTALRYLSWRAHAAGVNVAEVILGPVAGSRAGRGAEEMAAAIRDDALARDLSAGAKHDLLHRIATASGVDFEAFLATGMYQQMTPAQVAALPGDLIDVELHTHRHRTPRAREAFTREITDNRDRLQAYRGNERFEHFCYPSGDYWGEFVGWLRGLGVTSATTCVAGLVDHDADRLLLPRFLDSMLISDLTFDAWTSGLAALLPRRTEYQFDAARVASRAELVPASGTPRAL